MTRLQIIDEAIKKVAKSENIDPNNVTSYQVLGLLATQLEQSKKTVTDEDIKKESLYRYTLYLGSTCMHDVKIFQKGAKWMRDQLSKQT